MVLFDGQKIYSRFYRIVYFEEELKQYSCSKKKKKNYFLLI
jgi:hypothetical protein